MTNMLFVTSFFCSKCFFFFCNKTSTTRQVMEILIGLTNIFFLSPGDQTLMSDQNILKFKVYMICLSHT